jgi:hypothetical protein
VEPRRFAKTVWCWGSDPITPENRREVLDWVLAWGGHGALTPDGTEDELIVLYTANGEHVVKAGQSVVQAWGGGEFFPDDLSAWTVDENP